jgi:protein-S-isoprenylcysteine O-methyltransferase Ste14
VLTAFSIWFGICFICYLLRTVFNLLKLRQERIVKSKAVVAGVHVVMFILWFSWFQMCLADPMEIALPQWLRYVGLTFFIAGVLLFVVSQVRMRGFEDRGRLVAGGIYSRIRNPMYLGFVIWVIGFPVFMQRLLALLSSTIWVTHLMIWKASEEKELERKYPEYREYKEKTWF